MQLKLSALHGRLALLTSESGEALFAYNRSWDYVAAVIHLANVLELEALKADATTSATNVALVKNC